MLTVVFVLTRLGSVFGPTVKRRAAIRTVEVHREIFVTMVLKTNDGFSTLLHPESRSR